MGYWWGAHGLALFSLLVSGLAPAMTAPLAAVLVGHGALRRPRLPGQIVVHRDRLWSLPGQGLVKQPARPASLLSPFLVRVVLVDLQGKPHVLWLARDSMSPDQWRRLQVIWRHLGAAA